MKDAFMEKTISFATHLHDLRICAYNKRGIREAGGGGGRRCLLFN